MIDTIYGVMDETVLDKTEGVFEDENEYTIWVEYRKDTVLVHRSAHVTIKQGTQSGVIAAAFS